MPGNCGAEARCFPNSTDWFREEPNFSIAAASTDLFLVVTPLVSIMKGQVE